MKAVEFFRQVQRAEKELKLLKAKVQHFEDLGLSITSHIGGVGAKQRGASKTEAAAVGYLDSTRALNMQIAEYTAGITEAWEGVHVSGTPDSAYYYSAVVWALVNEVTAGTSQTTFSPTDTCTRGQVVTFLCRYMTAREEN